MKFEKRRVVFLRHGPTWGIVPQAIFWRPLRYFSAVLRDEEDELDRFQSASFSIGNQIQFDLRHYHGHPDFTSSLYLHEAIEDLEEIESTIEIVIASMIIPRSALVWRRGQPFEYGVLRRQQSDRLREPEARDVTLKIASLCPNRTASTTRIKQQVPQFVDLSKADRRISNSRNEPMWKQIVGNVTSHSDSSTSIFRRNLAVKVADGIRVTTAGLDYLKSLGFCA